jgi:hypothetical protein
MGSKTMNKTVVGALSAVVLFVAFPADVHAQRAGAQHNQGQVDYERSASSGQETVLVHTKSPAKHTVCQTLHDSDQAIIHYDDNEMILGPGHCVMVEAQKITATSSGDSRVNLYGRHHQEGINRVGSP